jgi:quercetin dioxygenase-like cupin family protein
MAGAGDAAKPVADLPDLRAELTVIGPVPPPFVIPSEFTWETPPGAPDLRVAWVVGKEKAPGPYVLRVKMAKGGSIPLHAHPDTRVATVHSGSVRVTILPDRVFDAPAGSVYVIPAAVPHKAAATNGNVEYQEVGFGPTGTEFMPVAGEAPAR